MKPLPTLKTARLELREVRDSDGEMIYRLYSDARVVRYHNLERLVRFEDASELVGWMRDLRSGELGLRWVIVLQKAAQAVGTIGYEYLDAGQYGAEVSYDLLPNFWGQGLMSEALGAVIGYVREQTSLLRLEAHSVTENKASIRVLEKAGFTPEGEPAHRTMPSGIRFLVQQYGLGLE